jgi:hypothetical protein
MDGRKEDYPDNSEQEAKGQVKKWKEERKEKKRPVSAAAVAQQSTVAAAAAAQQLPAPQTAPPSRQQYQPPINRLSVTPADLVPTTLSPLTEPGQTLMERSVGAVDTRSLTDSIVSRQSGMRNENTLETIEEIIHWANNKVGDGGDSDIKGSGYLHAIDFLSETNESNGTKLAHDYDKIEMNVDDASGNYTVLFAAPNGWEPPTAPEKWKLLTLLVNDNEALFSDVDNPGEQDNFMFQPKFSGRYSSRAYSHRALPTGA